MDFYIYTTIWTSVWPGGASSVREDERPEEVKQWFAQYEQRRVQGLRDPHSLQRAAPDFELVPPSQIIAGMPAASFGAQISQAGAQEGECKVSTMWKPAWLASPESFELPVFVDTQVTSQTMAEQLERFRRKIDEAFGWAGKVLPDVEVGFRAAAQAVLL